jgi:branched-chain amino acid transport system permease protein
MSVDATTAMSVPLLQSRYADRRLHLALFAVLGVLLLAAPLVVYPVFLMKILCFALFASAFNLLLGFGGLLSFGHAAFFGMAAYVSAHASARWGTSAEVSVLLGAAVAAILGLAIGSISIRRQGIYFAMVTLAFAQMVFFFALQAPFTGGEDGIQRVPRGALFGFFDISADLPFYYFVATVTFACLVLIYRAIHSPFGQVLKAIRDNENRAISLGYRAERYKLLCFVLSSTLAGVAGGLKALVFQLASLTDVAWQMSGEVVLMTLLGGMGTIFGPLVGAALIVTMQNYLAELGAWVTIIQGGIFVLCVLLFRKGIVGVLAKLTRRPL